MYSKARDIRWQTGSARLVDRVCEEQPQVVTVALHMLQLCYRVEGGVSGLSGTGNGAGSLQSQTEDRVYMSGAGTMATVFLYVQTSS